MKTLLVRQDKLGDCLLATSTITSLCERLGSSEVGILCQPAMAPLFHRHPASPKVLTGPYRPKGLEIVRTALAWRREGWEAILLPKEDSGGYTIAARLAGAGKRVGQTAKWHGRLLTSNFMGKVDASLHEVLLMKAMAEEALQGGLSEAPLVFPPLPMEEKQAGEALEGLGDCCVLCPFTGGTSRPWPPELFAALGSRIARELELTVLVAGGPDQVEMAEKASQFPGAVNVAGLGGLGTLAAMMRKSRFVVSVNSGLIHLAATQGVPVCVIETREDHATAALRWSPWMTPYVTAAPHGQGDPTVEEVWECLKRLLAGRQGMNE